MGRVLRGLTYRLFKRREGSGGLMTSDAATGAAAQWAMAGCSNRARAAVAGRWATPHQAAAPGAASAARRAAESTGAPGRTKNRGVDSPAGQCRGFFGAAHRRPWRPVCGQVGCINTRRPIVPRAQLQWRRRVRRVGLPQAASLGWPCAHGPLPAARSPVTPRRGPPARSPCRSRSGTSHRFSACVHTRY